MFVVEEGKTDGGDMLLLLLFSWWFFGVEDVVGGAEIKVTDEEFESRLVNLKAKNERTMITARMRTVRLGFILYLIVFFFSMTLMIETNNKALQDFES